MNDYEVIQKSYTEVAEPLPEEKTDDEQSQQPPSIHKQESKVSS